MIETAIEVRSAVSKSLQRSPSSKEADQQYGSVEVECGSVGLVLKKQFSSTEKHKMVTTYDHQFYNKPSCSFQTKILEPIKTNKRPASRSLWPNIHNVADGVPTFPSVSAKLFLTTTTNKTHYLPTITPSAFVFFFAFLDSTFLTFPIGINIT